MRMLLTLLALGAFGWSSAHGFGLDPDLESGQAYRARLAVVPSAATVLPNAQALGWWVRMQTGEEITYFNGLARCEACDPNLEAQFYQMPQLTVDGADFMARLDTEAFRLNLRPQSGSTQAYELVVMMHQTLGATVVAQQAQQALAALGVALGEGVAFEPLSVAQNGKTLVPNGVHLEETLYRLALAPDWPDFAQLRGLTLSGLRVEVIVELAEGQALPGNFDLIVEQTSGQLARVQVRISDLVALAQAPGVVEVRPPLSPQPGGN